MAIGLVCDSIERARFFSRLTISAPENQFWIIYSEPRIPKYFPKHAGNIKFYRLKPTSTPRSPFLSPEKEMELKGLIEQSIEVLNNRISIKNALHDTLLAYDQFNKFLNKNHPSLILIWNGQQLIGRITAKCCRELSIKTKFIEISNLPNKLFCDEAGVNALSSIASRPQILDSLDRVDEEKHNQWLNHYVEHKSMPLPQAKTNLKNIINLGENFFSSLVNPGLFNHSGRLMQGIKRELQKKVTSRTGISESPTPYIFAPLQCSNDTQIRLHSKINNIELIEKSFFMAEKDNLNLVVKIHPAETDGMELKKIHALQKKLNFTVSNKNTTDLIREAECISTINSTIGLEAMIYRKTLHIHGEALYRNFNHERLKKYIHEYLIDGIDYFGTTPIPKKSINRILS